MSKKKFTSGLESLFEDSSSSQERLAEEQFLYLPERRKDKPAATQPARKSGKQFARQLASFLDEAMDAEGDAGIEVEVPVPTKAKRRVSAPRSGGLDALLRNTIDTKVYDDPEGRVRRLYLHLKQVQLDRLKDIAEQRGVSHRDLLLDLVLNFIESNSQDLA